MGLLSHRWAAQTRARHDGLLRAGCLAPKPAPGKPAQARRHPQALAKEAPRPPGGTAAGSLGSIARAQAQATSS